MLVTLVCVFLSRSVHSPVKLICLLSHLRDCHQTSARDYRPPYRASRCIYTRVNRTGVALCFKQQIRCCCVCGGGGEIGSSWVGMGSGKDVETPLICERIPLSLLLSLELGEH